MTMDMEIWSIIGMGRRYGPSLAWGGDMVHHWHGEEIWSIIGMGRRYGPSLAWGGEVSYLSTKQVFSLCLKCRADLLVLLCQVIQLVSHQISLHQMGTRDTKITHTQTHYTSPLYALTTPSCPAPSSHIHPPHVSHTLPSLTSTHPTLSHLHTPYPLPPP